MLARCEDYVRLKIRKVDQELEDEEDAESDWITFTVELKRRHGQALGFTISGTEDPLDVITVSNIAQNGLAARTGTLRKSDEIQAINGVTLRTRPLSEAISLLQNSNEAVVLKIRRDTSSSTAGTPNVSNSTGTTHTSGLGTMGKGDGSSTTKSSRKTPPSLPKKGKNPDIDSRRVLKY